MTKAELMQYAYNWLGAGAASKTASDLSNELYHITDGIPDGMIGDFNSAVQGLDVRDDIEKLAILLLGYYKKVEEANSEATEIMDLITASDGNVSFSGNVSADGVFREEGERLAKVKNAITYDAFTGGTLLRNQTNNTICRLSSLSGITPSDLPPDLVSNGVGLNRYAWLLTMGNANAYKMQILFVSTYHVMYTRFETQKTQDGVTSKIWGDWMTDTTPTLKYSTFQGTVDGVTALRNQPGNTACWISNLSVVTLLSDVPDELLNAAGTSVRQLYAYLETIGLSGENPRMQRLSLTQEKLQYHRFFREGSNGWGWTPWYSSGGGGQIETPKYVALGASTVAGAVHRVIGTVWYSENNYPDYVGEALGLDTVNLAVGSTGFLARYKNQLNNHMDIIFDNKNNVFDNAALITLSFGYGNDYGNGDLHLPIGEWDDYFPFDQYRVGGSDPTRVTNATPAEMVGAGATLFGCLNWCIKWIGEHYPLAQFMVIFGWPSQNIPRTVTVTSDKIIVLDGYKAAHESEETDDDTEKKRRIYQIIQEFPKLRAAMNTTFIDTVNDRGMPINWYMAKARFSEFGKWKVFSTVAAAAGWHPCVLPAGAEIEDDVASVDDIPSTANHDDYYRVDGVPHKYYKNCWKEVGESSSAIDATDLTKMTNDLAIYRVNVNGKYTWDADHNLYVTSSASETTPAETLEDATVEGTVYDFTIENKYYEFDCYYERNTHPNNNGYLLYSRYMAGLILSNFRQK